MKPCTSPPLLVEWFGQKRSFRDSCCWWRYQEVASSPRKWCISPFLKHSPLFYHLILMFQKTLKIWKLEKPTVWAEKSLVRRILFTGTVLKVCRRSEETELRKKNSAVPVSSTPVTCASCEGFEIESVFSFYLSSFIKIGCIRLHNSIFLSAVIVVQVLKLQPELMKRWLMMMDLL